MLHASPGDQRVLRRWLPSGNLRVYVNLAPCRGSPPPPGFSPCREDPTPLPGKHPLSRGRARTPSRPAPHAPRAGWRAPRLPGAQRRPKPPWLAQRARPGAPVCAALRLRCWGSGWLRRGRRVRSRLPMALRALLAARPARLCRRPGTHVALRGGAGAALCDVTIGPQRPSPRGGAVLCDVTIGPQLPPAAAQFPPQPRGSILAFLAGSNPSGRGGMEL